MCSPSAFLPITPSAGEHAVPRGHVYYVTARYVWVKVSSVIIYKPVFFLPVAGGTILHHHSHKPVEQKASGRSISVMSGIYTG